MPIASCHGASGEIVKGTGRRVVVVAEGGRSVAGGSLGRVLRPAPARREDSRDVATVRATSVQRDPKEMRTSISSLHEKPHLSDITVSVQLSDEHEAQDFQCISALLASASRVLEAMLFGPMADASLLDQA